MIDCNVCTAKVFPYVDGELTAPLREEIETHLVVCPGCRGLVERELKFREACAVWLQPEPAPDRVRAAALDTLHRLSDQRHVARSRRRLRWVGLATAALALLTLGAATGVAVHVRLQARDNIADFAVAAVEQHQKLARNLLPRDVQGVSPKGAEQWFRQRLAFNVTLPELPGDGLVFRGGRISHVRDVEAAALEYEIEGKHVSLFIMAEEAYRRLRPADKPRFTVMNHRGYDVILWQSNGTGYTLVSEVGARSCLICHRPDEAVQDKIQELARSPARL
jgi:anti-sigma factor RsiW